MAELKKCWRQKVVAEMTAVHLQQFAHEMGTSLSAPDALIFLNEHGEYIKSKLQESHRKAARHAVYIQPPCQ